MRVALVGTRGVPARYGGFETAVEEVGSRLAAGGHSVTVYCRGGDARLREHRGMHLVHRPALRRKTLETLSHTALSLLHVATTRPDVVLLFNAANAPLLPLVHAARVPVATHVDGLEWQRGKWSGAGRRYYQRAERLAVRWSDALIADARGIQDYYEQQHSAQTVLLSYGAPLVRDLPADPLAAVGLEPDGYHLVVARFEPENNVHLIVDGYRRSAARLPLVVVGGAPYADAYQSSVQESAAHDPRVRFLGPVWDQVLLDTLYAHSRSYLHGHSVGGTNPSLLRAAGAAAPVLALDVVFNREVLAANGRYFSDEQAVRLLVEEAENDGEAARRRGAAIQQDVVARYDWDDVADGYERLCRRLVDGQEASPTSSARRSTTR